MTDKYPINTVVGIDIETTSLDPAHGDIIEIAAIRYDLASGHELDQYVQLTKPHYPITAQIRALTGINESLLTDAPRFSDIKNAVSSFIGTDAVFAHNASFDTRWLKHHGVPLTTNTVWDTFPLACIAWPEAVSYNLGALAAMLDIAGEVEHRAAADVEVTWRLLLKIKQELSLDRETLQSVTKILRDTNLTIYQSLFSLNKQSYRAATSSYPSAEISDSAPTTRAINETKYVNSDTPSHSQSNALKKTITDLIQSKKKGLIEAGPGLNRTTAYLAAALPLARVDAKVIIATATGSLARQLIEYDLPIALRELPQTLTIATLHERSSYLCTRRLDALIQKGTYPTSQAFTLLKIVVWHGKSRSTNLHRLNVSHQEVDILPAVHADALSCRAVCSTTYDCPYQQAVADTKKADVIITSHGVLIAIYDDEDLQLPIAAVIIDEADQLETSARTTTKLDLSQQRLDRTLAAITHGDALGAASSPSSTLSLTIQSGYQKLCIMASGLFTSISTANDTRIISELSRSGSPWRNFEHSANSLLADIKLFIGMVKARLDSTPVSDTVVQLAIRDLEAFSIELTNFVTGTPERIQWLTAEETANSNETAITFHDVAASVPAVLAPLISTIDCVILLSDCMAVNQSYSFIKRVTGFIPDVEIAYSSPTKNLDQLLIYLTKNTPLPTESDYIGFIANQIGAITTFLQGRTYVLCTSKQMVNDLYELLINDLDKERIAVLAQGISGGRASMLRRVKSNPRTLLLGTISYWQGLAIPVTSLPCLIIPRLPFPNPHEPIINGVAAINNVDQFTNIAIPRMITTLRQTLNQLLDDTDGRTAMVILDSRALDHQYRNAITNSLTSNSICSGPVTDIQPRLKTWFGGSPRTV